MIPKNTLIKETFIYALSKTVPGIVGLASVILFIRFTGAEEYGKYSYLLSQWNLIVAIGFGWMNQAQLRYYSKDKGTQEYLTSQLKSFTYSSILVLTVFSILSLFQSFSFQLWAISFLSIISIGGFNYLKTLLQAKLEPINVIWLTISQSILALIIPLGLLYLFPQNSITLLLGVGLSFLIVILLIGFKTNKNQFTINQLYKFHKTGKTLVKKWIAYGAPLSIWFTVGMGLPFLDRFFINLHLQGETLGVYAGIQELLTRVFSITIFPLTLALHPRIMTLWNESKKPEAMRIIGWGIGVMMMVAIILGFAIVAFEKTIFEIIELAIPQANSHYRSLIIPLLLAGFLWQLSFLSHKMLELNERTKTMAIFLMVSLLINVVGNSIYIPQMGVQATAITALFSALVYCGLTGIYSITFIMKAKA